MRFRSFAEMKAALLRQAREVGPTSHVVRQHVDESHGCILQRVLGWAYREPFQLLGGTKLAEIAAANDDDDGARLIKVLEAMESYYAKEVV